MDRLICLDGIDNTGKTWLTNRLKELYPEIGICSFPSNELVQSELFSDLIRNPSIETSEKWLEAVYKEEYIELGKVKDKSIVVVDRFWYSSLIYQGSGFANSFKREQEINLKYQKMMEEFDLQPKNILHVLFSYPLVPKDDRERNTTKKAYDDKTVELYGRLEDLINALLDEILIDPYLSRFVRFSEPSLHQHWVSGTYPNLFEIQKIQNARVAQLSLFCGLMH